MIFLVPKDISPVTLTHNYMRLVAMLNCRGRPWSLVSSAFSLIIPINLGIFAGLEIILVHGSVQEIIKSLGLIAISLHIGCKMINILMHQKEIEDILLRLEDIRNEIYNDSENKMILRKSDTLNNVIVVLLVLGSAFSPVFSLIINLLVDYVTQPEKPHLPYQLYVPWSMKEFWQYIAGGLSVTLLPVANVFLFVAATALNITFTIQISIFTKVLQRRLEKYGADGKSIHDHQRIILLIQDFNILVSGQMYLETCLTCLQQCGFGFPLLKTIKTGDPTLIDWMFKWLYIVMTPYLVCVCGQEISTQTEKLHHSAYMSNWYEQKPKDRVTLVILMTSTLQPITLNYRKLAFFNFVLLSTIYQGFYSYLTFLINLDP